MENNAESMDTKSGKVDMELPPPAYSEVVHKYSATNSPVLKLDSFTASPTTSEKDNPMLDKMVHLETLCSSMHTMLEFQNFAYLDVKGQLSEISRSNRSNEDDAHPRNSRTSPKLSMVSGADDEHSEDRISCESSVLSDVGECDDSGFDRVCNMLEHLLSDAKIAIDKLPEADEVSYHEESDEELASSACLVSPIRDDFAAKRDGLFRKSNTVSVTEQSAHSIPEVDELKVWCQFVRNGIENQPYEIRRKMILPNLNLDSHSQHDSLDLYQLKTSKFLNDDETLSSNQPILFSMIYWTLCFTLGVLLLDRYLVELASRQITLTMESLLPGPRIDFGNPPISEFDEDDDVFSEDNVLIRRNSM
ncbi:hypothetical protein K7432_004402 [Basidiobolus ranarum]|uniref:Uncharacterized protein n=1 Tax=Basidiobolus ranarum TaxID=34480 RepID=A0ABR2WYC3_9FUNG